MAQSLSWNSQRAVKKILKNTFILRKARVANFADIIKITTKFIKKTFKESNKVKQIRGYVLKCNLYLHFHITKVPDFQ